MENISLDSKPLHIMRSVSVSHLKILWRSETEIFCSAETFLTILEVLRRKLFLAMVHRDLSTIIGLFFDIIGLEKIIE